MADCMIIRQRDEHAWAEVWMGPAGWGRVDPTAAVAPSRVQLGIDEVLPAVSSAFGPALERNSALGAMWHGARNSWDALNNGWNQWVLGYGPMRQRQLFSRFGIQNPQWEHHALMILLATCSVLILIGLRVLAIGPDPADRVRALYDRFCAKLAKRGIKRAAYEGPLDFALRASAAHAALAAEIDEITALYVRLRYAGAVDGLDRLVESIKRFPSRN